MVETEILVLLELRTEVTSYIPANEETVLNVQCELFAFMQLDAIVHSHDDHRCIVFRFNADDLELLEPTLEDRSFTQSDMLIADSHERAA